MRRYLLSATAAIALLATGASAHDKHPVTLIEGLGDHHHTIATAQKDAQSYFNQGLILTFAFNHAEAIQAYERAAELDPNSPMPLWGIAYALGPNYNLPAGPEELKLAHETVQKALKLADKAPARERAYIEALAARYSSDPNADYAKLAADFSARMKALSEAYPDDLDAATLYAESMMNLNPWNLWTKDGKPWDRTMEIVAVLEGVLKRDPSHPGANHLYIHAVEASPHPEWALAAAKRLETISPASGHLVHMPSHIYMLVGDYKAAADANVIAAKVDKDYIDNEHVKGAYPMLYFHHNLHFIAAARGMEGRYGNAAEAASRLTESLHTHADDIPGLRNFVTEYFGMYPLLTAARFHDWKTVLAAKEPAKDLPISRGLRHYARGVAFAADGDVDSATAERNGLEKIIASLPMESRYGNSPAKEVLSVGLSVVDARIAQQKGDLEKAVAALTAAVAIQDKLAYNEPADWHYPVRESLGAALLKAGKASEAEAVFRDDLKKNPRGGRSLFGLAETLEAQGKTDEAMLVRQEFNDAWRTAEIEPNLDTM
ncbi:MAG TPA: tetratricopeptide repeat protein [Dongiaceae bacterium]|nr:tetratricopeptide repeat protein [Dongiaceae bacterium]